MQLMTQEDQTMLIKSALQSGLQKTAYEGSPPPSNPVGSSRSLAQP
jgi:hypothetical protein